MNNLQLYFSALAKTWWLLGIIIISIVMLGVYEAVENKWEGRKINGKNI